MIRHALNLNHLPPLTDAQAAELAALAIRADDDVDLSDIPEMTDEQFKAAVKIRRNLPRSSKKPA